MRHWYTYCCLLLCLLAVTAWGQNKRHAHLKLRHKAVPVVMHPKVLDRMFEAVPDTPDTTKPFICYFPEYEMPRFPGNLNKFLDSNFRYPPADRDSGISGRVIVGFTIHEDGRVDSISILRSLSPASDSEALRVVRLLPNFIPGKQNEKVISMHYVLPITLELD